jgi:hypothetical protein
MNDTTKTTKGTYCARAQVMRTERMTISVEMRPPKKGELGWTVPLDADVKEALLQVIDGRGEWDEGQCGYGVHVERDWPEVERDEWVQYEIDPATGRVAHEIDPTTGYSTGRVKDRGVHESRCVTVVISWESCEIGEVVLL